MNDMENMRVFADQLWKYMVPKINAKLSSNVSYFRAQVVSNPGDGTLVIQRPLENGTLTLPCTAAASNAQPGQQVVALVMGSLSNAVVVGDGMLNPPVTKLGPADIVTLYTEKGGLPFNKLVADIALTQAGSGNPSPENPRAITGFTGLELHIGGLQRRISWETEAGTVYGGTLDVLRGLLTVTWVGVDVHDSTPLTYNGIRYFRKNLTTAAAYPPSTQIISNVFRTNPGLVQDNIIYVNNPGTLIIMACADTSITTAAQFNDFLDANDAQVVYKLATPARYWLTPPVISSLAGSNSIWTDVGDVTVEYGDFLRAIQAEIENLHR